MKYELDREAHSVYALQYHLIQCVKDRQEVLEGDCIEDYLRIKVNEISDTFEVKVLNLECDKDYFHMIFKSKPTLDIPKYLNAVKTITSRELRRNFPGIKGKLTGNALWSRSYFIATTGQVCLDTLMKYVDEQGGV